MSHRLLIIFCMIWILVGCEKENQEIRVAGKIVDEVTSLPIFNIGVNLKIGTASYGSYPIVSSARTDSTGGFALYYDPKDDHTAASATMYVNDSPYDDSYTVLRFEVQYGEHWNKTLYIKKKSN